MTDLLGFGAFGSANAAATRPTVTPGNGSGDPDTWGKNCSSVLAADGTEISADWANALLAQIRSLIRKSGVTLDNTDDHMLTRAVRSHGLNYDATVAGTANAWSVTLDPAPGSWAELEGTPLHLKLLASNTATSVSLDIAGLTGSANVLLPGGRAITPGSIPVGIITVMYTGTHFVVLSPTAANVRSHIPIDYITVGTVTLTVPEGVYVIVAEVWGGGGGGGGALNSSCAASGGGAGAYAMAAVSVTPGQVIPITVGAGGAGGSAGGGNGGDGGASSVGGYVVCAGGNGGLGSSGSPAVATPGGTGGAASGGSTMLSGGGGSIGYPVGGGLYIGGTGAGGFQGAVSPITAGAAGGGASFPAGGGGGASNNATGGDGSKGWVRIYGAA